MGFFGAAHGRRGGGLGGRLGEGGGGGDETRHDYTLSKEDPKNI